MAALTSPFWLPTKAWSASRPAFSISAIVALDTLAFGPSSHTMGSASSAVLACHHVSATTATAESPTCTTCRTPGMPLTLAASKLFTLPPNTGQSLIAALSMPGQLQVGAVDLRAGQLVGVSRRFTDLPMSFQSFGSLSGTSAGGGELGGGLRHLAVRGRAAGGPVRDHAVGGAALGGRHPPASAAAWISIMRAVAPPLRTYSCEAADAAAAARGEVAPRALARDALAGRRVLGRHLRPVALELLGHQLGEAGERALPHLGARDPDHDRVVRADDHPGVDLGRAVLRADDARAERDLQAQREPAADRGGADDEGATIDLRVLVIMASTPYALAAAWMASRTCWNVPQRQMLVIVASMSASVGFGLSFRSAATAMIMPAWQ